MTMNRISLTHLSVAGLVINRRIGFLPRASTDPALTIPRSDWQYHALQWPGFASTASSATGGRLFRHDQ